MEKWYQTKEGCNLQHAGQVITAGKKIFLSEDLASLHNSVGEQLVVCDEPASIEEVAVIAEWDYLQEQKANNVSSAVSSARTTKAKVTSNE